MSSQPRLVLFHGSTSVIAALFAMLCAMLSGSCGNSQSRASTTGTGGADGASGFGDASVEGGGTVDSAGATDAEDGAVVATCTAVARAFQDCLSIEADAATMNPCIRLLDVRGSCAPEVSQCNIAFCSCECINGKWGCACPLP